MHARITSAVRIAYDARTDLIEIIANPLPYQVCARLSREPYTIKDDGLLGWGYTHRISVDPLRSVDLSGDYLVTFGMGWR